ncbi:hypothetical protein [Nonomuraea gerenzanensis]|uniref:hypothetical protein n=1 Tax=Nonomuraea gerenzanensis TaxID=93944 RepID=UPI001CDA547A|nr:hypothetical protein [Nonomuraea gerenzanensis]UBU19152.1 hypothetical protein LCN96_39375 [Nonomuraea gerenzanensis]
MQGRQAAVVAGSFFQPSETTSRSLLIPIVLRSSPPICSSGMDGSASTGKITSSSS